jgi:cell division protein FtsZ
MMKPKLMVMGVGGAGSNAVDRMIQIGLKGIDYAIANTDAQALANSEAPAKVLLGKEIMRGRGAGGDPKAGAEAAVAATDDLRHLIDGTVILFLAVGLGGGTGTGASPIIAKIARESNALVVGIVTLPFSFEGRRRQSNAQLGLAELANTVDTLVVVPNDYLIDFVDTHVSLDVAFRVADDILRQGIEGISTLIVTPGLINLDLASVHEVLSQAGGALLAIGYGEGEQRGKHAAQAALDSPLIDMSAVPQAKNVLVNITGGPDLTLFDVREAMELVNQNVHREAALSMGAVIDPLMAGRVQMTLIAGGLKTSYVTALPTKKQSRPRLSIVSTGNTVQRPVRKLREVVFEMPEFKRRSASA